MNSDALSRNPISENVCDASQHSGRGAPFCRWSPDNGADARAASQLPVDAPTGHAMATRTPAEREVSEKYRQAIKALAPRKRNVSPAVEEVQKGTRPIEDKDVTAHPEPQAAEDGKNETFEMPTSTSTTTLAPEESERVIESRGTESGEISKRDCAPTLTKPFLDFSFRDENVAEEENISQKMVGLRDSTVFCRERIATFIL